MKRRTSQNNKYGFIIITVICLSIYFLSVGYSAFSATAKIEGIMATVSPKADARITGIAFNNTSNGGSSSSEDYNMYKIMGTISLPNSDSTVTYKVSATVFNAAEMKISAISGLPSNLEYTLTDYTLGDVLCNTNNECNLGATKDFYITIGYKSGGYNSSNTDYSFNMDFTFEQLTHTAKIGNTYYQTLQDALDAVPTTGVSTTVTLLKNVSEELSVDSGQNVVLSLSSHTISNVPNKPVIENAGTLTISDGIFTSNAQAGIINNTGTLYITGGTFNATGKRQVLYNNGGTCEISGNPVMTANTNERAPLHNLANSTLIIKGGTITSNNYSAVENLGTLVIGEQGGTPSKTVPSLKGKTYGVTSTTNYSFYDGILKGLDGATDDDTKITSYESGYSLYHKADSSYDTMFLAQICTVNLDANGGTVSPASISVDIGGSIGPLPTPVRTDYAFDGWFTAASGGTQVTASTVMDSCYPLYAHWTEQAQVKYAKVDNVEYATIAEAWAAATQTSATKTVVLIRDNEITSKLTVNSSKSVILDLNGYTLLNDAGTVVEVNNGGTFEIIDSASGGVFNGGKPNGSTQYAALVNRGTVFIRSGTIKSNRGNVIENRGSMTITGGYITIGNVAQGVINNYAGTLNISGGTIMSTYNVEKSQAVYNKATLNISGSAVLSSGCYGRATVHNDASGAVINISGGTITQTNTSCQRGAVQNVSGATLNITGGTITSVSTNANSGAVQNAGDFTLGTKDGNIHTNSPVLQGAKYAVNDTGTFNFYDGICKGISDVFNGTVDDVETNANIVYGTETISGDTYNTAILN